MLTAGRVEPLVRKRVPDVRSVRDCLASGSQGCSLAVAANRFEERGLGCFVCVLGGDKRVSHEPRLTMLLRSSRWLVDVGGA
jgi:hypothetical protein